MARLSRSAYQKAKLVSRDESLFRLRDHSEWGRRQSHEFYEYITSTSVRRLDRPGRGGEGPKSACTTCNSEKLFERWLHMASWKGRVHARPGGNWKVLLKIALVAEIRVVYMKHARHKSTFHRATRGTEADQRPPSADIVPIWFKMYPLDVVFQSVLFDAIVSRNWGNIFLLSFFLIWRIYT